MNALNKYQPYALAALRIVAGYTFCYMAAKLLGVPRPRCLMVCRVMSLMGLAVF